MPSKTEYPLSYRAESSTGIAPGCRDRTPGSTVDSLEQSNTENAFWPLSPSFLHFVQAAGKLVLLFCEGAHSGMLIARDYVGYMASEVVKKLVAGNLIETKVAEGVTQRIRLRMMDEITVEDRLNDEVRQILIERQDEMRRTGVSYQEMYKKVKAHLARDRKLVLR